MKEIGGYHDFERYHGPMLHEDGIKLNCGRNCLAYLLRAKGIKKIVLPWYICDSVTNLCRQYGLEPRFYHVGLDLRPELLELQEGEWLYVVNYYGQLTREEIQRYRDQYGRVIVDNAQAFFDWPVESVDTLYTCRKFFGVPDGAILYTDSILDEELERDESYEHMNFLTGRFERTASEFRALMVENNRRFIGQPIKKMSKLTENLLRSFDYEDIKRRRTENYCYLAEKLGVINQLHLREVEGAFAYPLMLENAPKLREKLISEKVYIPKLWPNVLDDVEETTTAFKLVQSILPLPCDQRYGKDEMNTVVRLIRGY